MEAIRFVPHKTAIIVVDLQKGIVGLTGVPHTGATVVRNTARILKAGRKAQAHVVLVHVGGAGDGRDRLHPIADNAMTPGQRPPDWADLVPELEQAPGDIVILKRQWGAFYGTDLDLQLRRRAITDLIVCGIATEFGVESTVRDAYERGYQQVLVADAMTALNAASHENATGHVFPRVGRVRDTDTVIAALEACTA